jgi:excinuclease ABC subunit C
MTKVADKLREQRERLPDSPGVYQFMDGEGKVLYVGKARSIRKRVASHFSKPAFGEMLEATERIEVLVTSNEAEALLAEQSFIKQHRPRFNIRLRDDKSYPYVGISLDEEFPRVYFTRERHRSGRVYFGPFSSAKRVRDTLDLLGKLFQYRTCEGPEPGRRSGVPCLDHYIKRCQAPCVGLVGRDEYRRNIETIIDFLSGRYRQIERDLKERMDGASEAQEFERAALYRDRLTAVQAMFERQRVTGGSVGTADLVGVAVEGTDANAHVFQVRDGVLSERHSFYLDNEAQRDAAEVAEEFLGQYYSAAPSAPRLIIVGPELDGRTDLLSEGLSQQRGVPVDIRVAKRGDKRRLREMAERNARLALAQDKLRQEHRRARRVEALDGLQNALGLEQPPVRIECFDVSNLGRDHTVASMVVFEGGAPRKAHYRRFNVRADRSGGPDDVASIEEVLTRRLARHADQSDLSPHDAERDESFASLPALIVIDGGKGQLSAGMRALAPFVEQGVAIISLAKRIEEVFMPGRRAPLLLGDQPEAHRLLQRVRDEAHRFAIEHHRGRRDRAMTRSVFDELRGVGPVRKRAFLEHFGTPERFLGASREELEAVPGVPGKLARDIHRQLNRAG